MSEDCWFRYVHTYSTQKTPMRNMVTILTTVFPQTFSLKGENQWKYKIPVAILEASKYLFYWMYLQKIPDLLGSPPLQVQWWTAAWLRVSSQCLGSQDSYWFGSALQSGTQREQHHSHRRYKRSRWPCRRATTPAHFTQTRRISLIILMQYTYIVSYF